MIHTECPICDAPMRLDDERASGACEDCGVTFEVATDDATAPGLALAA